MKCFLSISVDLQSKLVYYRQSRALQVRQSYAHYASTAVFHDPVSIAKGLDSIKSQFNGMPKVFESSTTQKCEVLDDPSEPNAIRLDLTQLYVFKVGKKEKELNSLITLKMNNGMIEHHEEEWDHVSQTLHSAKYR